MTTDRKPAYGVVEYLIAELLIVAWAAKDAPTNTDLDNSLNPVSYAIASDKSDDGMDVDESKALFAMHF